MGNHVAFLSHEFMCLTCLKQIEPTGHVVEAEFAIRISGCFHLCIKINLGSWYSFTLRNAAQKYNQSWHLLNILIERTAILVTTLIQRTGFNVTFSDISTSPSTENPCTLNTGWDCITGYHYILKYRNYYLNRNWCVLYCKANFIWNDFKYNFLLLVTWYLKKNMSLVVCNDSVTYNGVFTRW